MSAPLSAVRRIVVVGLPCLLGVWLAVGLTTGAGVGATGAKRLPGSCGDLRLDPGETCDDGNRADGDGCEADCGPPDPTLIAAYAFEEISGRTVLDASGGGADGTLVGGARRSRFGVHGAALLLDGSTGHAELGALPTTADDLTISLWLRPKRFDVFDAVLVARGGGTSDPNPAWVLGTFGPRLHFELRTAGQTTSLTAASTTLVAGTWTHVAARYDGTRMTLFQDGQPVRSTSKRGAMAAEPNSPVWLGDLPGGGRPFAGSIDQVRIHHRALDDNEIRLQMDTPLAGPPICGNGRIDSGESCDDGGRNSDTRANACRRDCSLPRCGDGVVDDVEVCDDGNLADGDECPGDCRNPPDVVPFAYGVIDPAPPWQTHVKEVGDIDGDGLEDAVTGGGRDGEGLYWYRWPDWTRYTIVPSGITGFTTDTRLADLDADGDLDLIVPKGFHIGESVWWYENPRPAGDPTTDPWTEHSIGDGGAHDVQVADIDGDGRLDVVTRFNETVLFLQREGATGWTRVVLNTRPKEGLGVGDIDGDGDRDVVLSGYWLVNPLPDGDPAVDPWVELPFDTGRAPDTKVHLADVNGDSRLDIVIGRAESAGGRLSWYSSRSPLEGPWTEHVIDDTADYCHGIGSADVDMDGDLDVVASEMHQSVDPDEVVLYINRGEGLLWSQQVVATSGSHNLRLTDVGGDGDIDIVGANWNGETPFEMWENQTHRKLSLDLWQRKVVDPAKPWRATFVLPADLDGDGLDDIVTGGWWYPNPGIIGAVWERRTIGAPLNNVAAIHDIDGDGDLDVLGTRGIAFQANDAFAWAENDGRGAFTVRTNLPDALGDFLQGVAVGPMVDGGETGFFLSWHDAASGIQTLTPPADPTNGTWKWDQIHPSSQGEELSRGDIDGDGDLDLVLGTTWLENQHWFWSLHTLFDTPDPPDRNRLADLNGDGRLDVIVGYEAVSVPGKLAWYEQPPVATDPWIEHVIDVVVGPMSLDLGDIDLDGDIDLVVGEHNRADPQTAKLWIFENLDRSGGEWAAHLVSEGDDHHDGAQLVDLDADGDLDIISIGIAHERVLAYENLALNPVLANEPPVANAGPDQVLIDLDRNGFVPVALDGTASVDPDGRIVSWDWTENGQAVAAGEEAFVQLPVGLHTITLTVTDDRLATDVDTTTVEILLGCTEDIECPVGQGCVDGGCQAVCSTGLPFVDTFMAFDANGDRPGWLDTGPDNSLLPADDFKVSVLDGDPALFTDADLPNIHSHYVAMESATWQDYRFTGRMRFDHVFGRIGVTILSDFPNADHYYRLRRTPNAPAFHLTQHGTELSCDVGDTGVDPRPGVWYRFEIDVVDTGEATELRTRVWQEGALRPDNWQQQCVDASATRRTTGTIGVWSLSAGAHYWDDLRVGCRP